jgi:hypothetical protein
MSGITTTVDPGSGLTALTRRGERDLSAKSECAGRTRSLDWWHVTYWLALLVCSSLIGIMVGGYVGFMENATPHAHPPYSFTQMAASDVGWAAGMKREWLVSHPLESAQVGQRPRETRRQCLVGSATGCGRSAASSDATSSEGPRELQARVEREIANSEK